MKAPTVLAAAVAAAATAAAPIPGLYGMGNVYASGFQLRRYDPGTAAQVNISAAGIYYNITADALSDIDPVTGTYFVLMYDAATLQLRYYGLDMATGKVTDALPVPFPETQPIGAGMFMAYDSAGDRLIAGGALVPAQDEYTVGFINRQTGAFTQITTFTSDSIESLPGATGFCPPSSLHPNGTLLFEVGDQFGAIYVVDLASGNYTIQPNTFPDGHDILSMDYDPVSGAIYGMGQIPNNGTWERTIARLDCHSGAVTIQARVPQYTNQYGGDAALNVAERALYWVGQPAGAPMEGPMYLVANSIVDGSVLSVSSNEVCRFQRGDFVPCPWSLQYLN